MRKLIISILISLLMVQNVSADIITSSAHVVRWDLSTLGIDTSFEIYVECADVDGVLSFKRIGDTFDAGADFTIGYAVTSLQNNIRISLTTSGPLTSEDNPEQTLSWNMVVIRDDGTEDEVISEEESSTEQTLRVYQHSPTEGISRENKYALRVITKDYITKPEDIYKMSVTLGIEVL